MSTITAQFDATDSFDDELLDDAEELDTEEDFEGEWVEEPIQEDPKMLQRPTPPRGFVAFKWPSKLHESGQRVSVCPECGQFGCSWKGGGYTDPEAQLVYAHLDYFQAIYEAHCPSREEAALMTDRFPNSFLLDLNYWGAVRIWDSNEFGGFRGVALKSHWSRYGLGECFHCGVQYWHDFVGAQWAYYYKPTKGQLGLF